MLLLHIFVMIHRFPSVGSSVFYCGVFLSFCLFNISGCAFRLSLVAESGLSSCGVQASHCGGFSCWDSRTWASEVVALRLSCSAAFGIFLDQGLNLCPLHWQADSYPLYHQGSPFVFVSNASSYYSA